ncbi:MAG: ATP-binding protein, partial [bacterium]
MAMRFPDGAWWVDLASSSDPLLVPALVAGSLGIREAADQDLAETLCDRLADDARLLVFDNCEHLAGAVAVLIELILGRCPSVAVLATSRARVGIEGEVAFLVPPLSMPGANDEMAWNSESVQLFVARAADAGASVAVSPAVAAICRELDGMPLALELAAARVRLLPPVELLARLDQPLRVLTDGPRDAPDRQRTLRATISWSYSLLDAAEQRLLRRASVFHEGWTLEAMEQV